MRCRQRKRFETVPQAASVEVDFFALRAPFVLGDLTALEQIFVDAGASVASIETQIGTARFPSCARMAAINRDGSIGFTTTSSEKVPP